MFPLINKRETGINLRRIMDMRGVTAKDVQQYLGLGCVQSVYRCPACIGDTHGIS